MANAQGSIIRITSGERRGHTTIGINGRHRRLPHGQDIPVSAAELEVLDNSRVTYERIGDATAKQTAGSVDNAVESATGAVDGSDTPAGGDNLNKEPPVSSVPVRSTPEPINQPAGGDNLTKQPPVDLAAAEQAATDAAQASADGTTEPVVVLTNADPDQTGVDADVAAKAAAEADAAAAAAKAEQGGDDNSAGDNLNKSPFSAKTTLEQPIAKITEDMDEFTPAQLKALRKAEAGEGGKNRVGVLAAIDKKLAS